MDRERFLQCLARQRAYCQGRSAVCAGILAQLEGAFKAAAPPWFERLSAAWGGRRFVNDYEAPFLLLAALNRRALEGRPESLGRPLEFLAGAADSFWEGLSGARLQTNEAGRSAGWLLVAAAAFRTRGLPFHLVDMGTSAGLNLIGDYLAREAVLILEDGRDAAEPDGWRDIPYPVLARLGLDARPLDAAKAEDRLWLKSCIWPDDAERLARFERAAELLGKLAAQPAGPRLLRCEFPDMPEVAAARLKPHPEEGLLLFNSQASDFLDDAAYEALRAGVARTLTPWGDRGFWAELEPPRGAGARQTRPDGESHELRVHRVRAGRLESRTLARLGARPKEIRLLPGWNFLAPLGPAAPPRITREEPPKQLQPGRYRLPLYPGGKE